MSNVITKALEIAAQPERYHGFTNRETWLASVWHDETIRVLLRTRNPESNNRKACEMLQEYFENEIHQALNHCSSFARDLADHALAGVNWQELYEHYEDE